VCGHGRDEGDTAWCAEGSGVTGKGAGTNEAAHDVCVDDMLKFCGRLIYCVFDVDYALFN